MYTNATCCAQHNFQYLHLQPGCPTSTLYATDDSPFLDPSLFFFQLFTKTAQKIKALLLCQTANVQCWENDKKHGFLTFNKNARLIVWRTCNVICMFFVHETLKNITHFTVQLHVRQQSAEKPGTAFKLSPITSYLVLGNSIHKKMKISHFTVQLHVCKSTIRR